jgi:hypothetical protein
MQGPAVQDELSPVRDELSPVRDELSPVRDEACPVRDELSPVREDAHPVRDNVWLSGMEGPLSGTTSALSGRKRTLSGTRCDAASDTLIRELVAPFAATLPRSPMMNDLLRALFKRGQGVPFVVRLPLRPTEEALHG